MRCLATLGLVVACSACGDDACPNGDISESCAPEFSTVRAGSGFACALDQHRRLWCWGDNANHEILGSSAAREPLAVLAGDRRWDSIATGNGHVCAIDDGELWCWGNNFRGQVSGDAPPIATEPFEIRVGVTWTAVSAGVNSTCAIGDGELFCWGEGRGGKLGTSLVDDQPFPVKVITELDDWTSVAIGARHTCAVSRSAGPHCWGDGGHGQLGNGLAVMRPTPERVMLDGEVTSIAVGLDTSCATTNLGELWCWGRATAGALGDPLRVDPDGPDVTTPVLASELTGWSDVAAAQHYACARRIGQVWCWGSSPSGGLGRGRWRVSRGFGPAQLEGAETLTVGWNASDPDPALDEGDLNLTCATGNGTVMCWGDNRSGQLGQGGASQSTVPVAIAGGRAWDALVAGDAHVCGLSTGTAWCWGSAERGQVMGIAAGDVEPCIRELCDAGAPVSVIPGTTRISAGAAHTCSLAGGALTCWGANEAGQCGAPPTLTTRPTTVVPGPWTALLGTGVAGTCAAMAGETRCWGTALSTSGATQVHEAALDGALVFARGFDVGCALEANGRLACFGTAALFGNVQPGTCGDGTCNNGETAASCAADCGPPPLTHLGRTYSDVAIGREAYACGLRGDGVVECWGDNFYGQTGEPQGQASPSPFALPLAGCTRLAAGNRHACAVCGGQLSCWGDASHGELGEPITIVSVTTPRAIATPVAGDEWIDVAAGGGFTCGRLRSGAGYCWGRSLHGALGAGPGSTGANLPIAVRL